MAKKYHAQITRDVVRTIRMGALVVQGMRNGSEQEIAPPRAVELPCKAGTISVHHTKKDRDAYIAAINAEHPGAARIWDEERDSFEHHGIRYKTGSII